MSNVQCAMCNEEMNDTYSDDEIRTMYRDAKNKSSMISVLSDLTLKPKWEINKILGLPYKITRERKCAGKYNKWTKEDDAILIKMFLGHKTRDRISEIMERSRKSVDSRIFQLKLVDKRKGMIQNS